MTQEDARDSYEIQEIEGIGPGFGRRLAPLNINMTLDLLEHCRAGDRYTSVAESLNVEPEVVADWTIMADLVRVPGVRGQSAELLMATGVKSVQDLAARDAANLSRDMAETNAREHRVPELPEAEHVEHWVTAASRLPVILHD